MAQQLQTQVKNPPPRMLTTNETLQSLNHWKTSFRTYYRRDSFYKGFLLENAVWNGSQENYGQEADVQGEAPNRIVLRTAADKAGDLEDFLNTLAGYLPFPYLTEKIVKSSRNLQNIWDIIYDHYGVNVSSESLLDYVSIKQTTGETYRQFFDRLLSHARLHLPKANITVDGVTSGANGEKMSISLMNFVAMDWLNKINPQLIDIVKTEYSRELRENTQLVELVPRISINIDAMLSRHDVVGGIEQLSVVDDDVSVDRVNRVRYGRGRGRGRGGSAGGNVSRRRQFCPECHYLSRKLQLDVNYNHLPADCPRPRAAVNMLLAGEEDFVDQFEDENVDFTGKIQKTHSYSSNTFHQMNCETPVEVQDDVVADKDDGLFWLSSSASVGDGPRFSLPASTSVDNDSLHCILNKICRLEQSNKNLRKEYSPQLRTSIGTIVADSTIDEGSELNCIDSSIAAQCHIKYKPVDMNAMAAGSNVMKLLGVVVDDIQVNVFNTSPPVILTLKNAVVIKNLGSNILIGEPGKMDNDIVTFPREKLIKLININGEAVKIPYHSRKGQPAQNYKACQVKSQTTLYPGDQINIPIPPSMQCNKINVTLRRDFSFAEPVLCNAKKQQLSIQNKTNNIVSVPKLSHLADLRTCYPVDAKNLNPDKLRMIYDISRSDWSHLTPSQNLQDDTQSYISQISVDPDNILPKTMKSRFLALCESFSDIITPRPGLYNGEFGHVSTDINFTSTPPSNLKSYLPRYSHEMLKVLGDKMDTLESWGVLRKPEDLGIVPEFVVPSLLVPKPDTKNEYRLVTDFTSLNKYIKKLPTVSPSIQEAKEKIAKYKYHVFLDLSNYYYQGGVKIEDSQYLATIHPFKGLLVYTVAPQGLLNSGEQAYERLGRIFGDMCADEKMTRMADGLYVLSNDLRDLYSNLKTVFERARKANLTFKPSKISICPRDIVVFGWRRTDNAWIPTEHTTNPLINASLPVTVKQLRSWIGSYKQLSSCIKDYSVPLSRLEKLTGSDKSSSLKIQWNDELKQDFENAKLMIKTLEKIYTPTPDDQLQTFSDYSQEHNAVGGRLVIVRNVDGQQVRLNGGYFSARLNKFQSKWLPCEGESLGIKLVLQHFSHFLRENKNVSLHFTDSLPCVQAFKRAKLGAFSVSARIATYLSSISSLNVDIIHTPGKQLHLVDYISRHPNKCIDNSCQICKFVNLEASVGDNVAKLNAIQFHEVMSGSVSIPFTQRQAWIDAQNRDKTHILLKNLINLSQAPDKKKTKDENTKLKLLFNLYREGKLKVHKDGLVTISHTEKDGQQYKAISVPTALFPGLIHALHVKLSHPSKFQLSKLIARYFYTPGYLRIIDEVSDSCQACLSMKQLPKEMFSESTGDIEGFGTNFSADVIERNSQQILIVREKLSSFTFTQFLPNQKADSLRQALISLILEFVPASGTIVQVDCATAWAHLATESETVDSELKKLKIKIDLGRHLNKNKNPVSDNACKEFHKEVLRLKPEGSALTDIERAIVTSNMNQRIRKSGYSSKEIAFKRDLIFNTSKQIDDNIIASEIVEDRKKHHVPVKPPDFQFQVGMNVFLKNDKTKLRARQMYIVVDIFQQNSEQWCVLQKQETQFRAKKYQVKASEIVLVPNQSLTTRPIRKSAEKARKMFSSLASVKSSQMPPPKHGWDYQKMLELCDLDDELIVHTPNFDVLDDNANTSNDATSSETSDFEDAAEETEASARSTSPTPPLLPRLPTNLDIAQDLSEQLALPEIQIATDDHSLQDIIEDIRTFNSEHPTERRRLRRNVSRPANYAAYSKTGKK